VNVLRKNKERLAK